MQILRQTIDSCSSHAGFLENIRGMIIFALMDESASSIRGEWIGLVLIVAQKGPEEFLYDTLEEVIRSLCKNLTRALSRLSKIDSFAVDYLDIRNIVSLIYECFRFLLTSKAPSLTDDSDKTISRTETGGFRTLFGLMGVFSAESELPQHSDSSNRRVRLQLD